LDSSVYKPAYLATLILFLFLISLLVITHLSIHLMYKFHSDYQFIVLPSQCHFYPS